MKPGTLVKVKFVDNWRTWDPQYPGSWKDGTFLYPGSSIEEYSRDRVPVKFGSIGIVFRQKGKRVVRSRKPDSYTKDRVVYISVMIGDLIGYVNEIFLEAIE